MKNFLRIRSVSRNRTEESENEDGNEGNTANVSVMDRKELESTVVDLQKKLKYPRFTRVRRPRSSKKTCKKLPRREKKQRRSWQKKKSKSLRTKAS